MSARPADADALLADWLPVQRWFGGKGRALSGVDSEAHLVADGEPSVWLYIVTTRYVDGDQDVYCVPISLRSASSDHLSYALIGEATTADGVHVWVHDALHDRDTSTIWTQLMATETTIGPVRFVRVPDAPIPTDVVGDALTVEQSNTSLVYGESAMVKFFRRIEAGLNPDVEVHEALAATGNTHLAALLGYATLALPDAEAATVAMAQEFVAAASDGWALATASVRDLYAEGDLHASEVGGDFAGEAHRLGVATASVHSDLARVLPTEAADREWLAQAAQQMRSRLDAACRIVPELGEHAATLHEIYDALLSAPLAIMLQRVHGDLHLGQVLRTASGWKILDFEGEPARPIAMRRALSPALRDVAAMLRSFDYAAHSLLLDGHDERQLTYRAREWSERNRDAFCDGYAEECGQDPREHLRLLQALEADKAVYETMYEARNRPAWLQVPLQSLERMSRHEGDQ